MAGVLVSIIGVQGSAPREVGARLWVGSDTIQGTIGGGALEYAMIAAARAMLETGQKCRQIDQPLGPEIGQCCGGRVQLLLEEADHLPTHEQPGPTVLIFGAGHVGSALARALCPLPFEVTVVDERQSWLSPLAPLVKTVQTPLPEAVVKAAPPGAGFVIMTHDHALDFLIAEAALERGDAAYVGMIGSSSKRARLASTLDRKQIDAAGLTSPIGAQGSRDKRPEVIAANVAAELAWRLL